MRVLSVLMAVALVPGSHATCSSVDVSQVAVVTGSGPETV